MASHDLPGGTYRVGDLTLTRIGYGATQLAGPGVFGPPKARDGAIAVLRAVVDLGIYPRHLRLLRPVRHERADPGGARSYPDDLHIVTKGGRPTRREGWLAAGARPRSCASRSTTTCGASGSTSSTS
jgi:hypothetical protein